MAKLNELSRRLLELDPNAAIEVAPAARPHAFTINEVRYLKHVVTWVGEVDGYTSIDEAMQGDRGVVQWVLLGREESEEYIRTRAGLPRVSALRTARSYLWYRCSHLAFHSVFFITADVRARAAAMADAFGRDIRPRMAGRTGCRSCRRHGHASPTCSRRTWSTRWRATARCCRERSAAAEDVGPLLGGRVPAVREEEEPRTSPAPMMRHARNPCGGRSAEDEPVAPGKKRYVGRHTGAFHTCKVIWTTRSFTCLHLRYAPPDGHRNVGVDGNGLAWRGNPASTVPRRAAAIRACSRTTPPPELDEQQAAFMKARGLRVEREDARVGQGRPGAAEEARGALVVAVFALGGRPGSTAGGDDHRHPRGDAALREGATRRGRRRCRSRRRTAGSRSSSRTRLATASPSRCGSRGS